MLLHTLHLSDPHRRGNYTGYFPSVTNCINRVHHDASIMYLEEISPRLPSAADYCTRRLGRRVRSVQLDGVARWQARTGSAASFL